MRIIQQPALDQERKRILRIALEPGSCRAEAEGVAPRIHVVHQVRATDAGQSVGVNDTSISAQCGSEI